MHNLKTVDIILIVAAVIILFSAGIMLGHCKNSQEIDAAQYCQMVHDKAWPDFHHVYAKECHSDGTINKDYIYGR